MTANTTTIAEHMARARAAISPKNKARTSAQAKRAARIRWDKYRAEKLAPKRLTLE